MKDKRRISKKNTSRDWRLELAFSQHLLGTKYMPGIVRERERKRQVIKAALWGRGS